MEPLEPQNSLPPQEEDWRLQGQERYLQGVTLYRRQWIQPRPEWHHDHCAFCWAKFMEADHPDTLHEGNATADNYYWICDTCFNDFRERFGWRIGDR
jgi:hypothetical protein